MTPPTLTRDTNIRDALDRVDLAALVSRFAGPGRSNHATTTFRCPHPDHDDRTPSFTVTRHRDGRHRWRCWSRCDASGDAADLLVWLGRARDTADALDQLTGTAWRTRNDWTPKPAPAPRTTTPAPVREPEPERPAPAEVLARFCEARRWPLELAEAWELRPVLDRNGRPRVRFPYRLRGAEVWGNARALDADTRPKYLGDPGTRPCPFGADRLDGADWHDPDRCDCNTAHPAEHRTTRTGVVFLTEGEPDAVALTAGWPSWRWQDAPVLGIPGVQALRGPWARAFAGLVVYLAADNDPAGDDYRTRASEVLTTAGASVRHLRVPPEHNDVSDWHAADPARFARELADALEHADHHHAEGVRS